MDSLALSLHQNIINSDPNVAFSGHWIDSWDGGIGAAGFVGVYAVFGSNEGTSIEYECVIYKDGSSECGCAADVPGGSCTDWNTFCSSAAGLDC